MLEQHAALVVQFAPSGRHAGIVVVVAVLDVVVVVGALVVDVVEGGAVVDVVGRCVDDVVGGLVEVVVGMVDEVVGVVDEVVVDVPAPTAASRFWASNVPRPVTMS